MPNYRPNGTPAGFARVCEHDSQRGEGRVWVCDDCGAETPKTPAQLIFTGQEGTMSPERIAYLAGWAASARTRTYDLDAAERRFETKHGRNYGGSMFAAGWVDYACDAEKFASLKDGE